ncbi:MAG TPA: flagellar hook-associated protein FlgL [Novosphingobium sp.]|nr:flagellar hook-associated protein FlgL [Novosphingobium sp.]
MTSVSTAAFYSSAIYNMNQLQQQTQDLQTQISTGNKLTHSYDDPLAAAQMRSLQAADSLTTADTSVSNAAKTSLNLTDTALTQLSNIVTEVKTLATQAANSTLTDTQRAAIGTQVSQYYSQLVSLANSQDANGKALFGGNGSGSAAYTTDATGKLTYVGTASAASVSLGAGLSVTTGVTGPDVLDYSSGGSQQNLLDVVKTLGDTLSASTSSTASNTAATTAANTALTTLADGLNAITTQQTVVGARLSWIATTSSVQTAITQQRATSESDVGGTDITTAVSKLQQTMTVLEAAQASFTKVSSLSLFSLLQ